MNASELIKRAKVQLILNHPFYATLALSVKYVEEPGIKTADIDGKVLRYNPTWIEAQNVEKTKGLIAHEVMHVALLHPFRRNGRNPKKWNRACDYAINQLLVDANFVLPSGGCIDSQYRGMSAEEIYKRLPDEPEDSDPDADGDPGGDGGVRDPQADTQQEMHEKEMDAKQVIAQAVLAGKQQGKMPGHLSQLIEEASEPIVNWKEILNSFLTEIIKSDYNFSHPSKRYLTQGLFLPSLRSVEKGNFVLIIDTSISVDNDLLKDFGGEMQTILASVAQNLTVYHVDTKVQAIEEYENDDELNLIAKGRGGTDFRPAFDHMRENGIDCAACIYFTDGLCNDFPDEPDFPVLWAIYNNKYFRPPFGDVLNIND